MDAPRTLPLHGYPWTATDAEVPVQFRATAVDPDGDEALTVTWFRFPDGAPAGTGANVQIPLSPAGRTRHVVDAVASDGDKTSLPAHALVFVDAPNFWDMSFDAEGRVRRIGLQDSRARLIAQVTDGVETVNTDATTALTVRQILGEWYVIAATGVELVVSTWPDMTLVDHVAIGPSASGVEVDADDNIVVAFYDSSTASPGDPAGAPVDTLAWSLAGGSLSPAPIGSVAVASSSAASSIIGPDVLFAPATGGIWQTVIFSGGLYVMHPGDSTAEVAPGSAGLLNAGEAWTGLAKRPTAAGSPEEIWATRGLRGLGTEIGEAAAVRFASGAATVFPLGAGNAEAIGWIDADRFWTAIPEKGLCIVDVPILEIAIDPSFALDCIPALDGVLNVAVDPVTGTAFWSSASALVGVRSEVVGTATSYFSGSVSPVVDPTGTVWFARLTGFEQGDIAAGRVAGLSGQGLVDSTTFASDVALDGEGGIWMASFFPNVLRRFGETGVVMDAISEIEVDSAQVIPIPVITALDESNGFLWIAGINDLFASKVLRIDTRAPRDPLFPNRATATSFAPNASGFPVFGQPFGATGPRATTPGLWLVASNLFAGPEVRYLSGLTATDVLTPPLLTTQDGAVSPAGERFCYAIANGPTASLYILDPPPVGLVLTSSWSMAGANLRIRAAAASSLQGQPAEDWCWIAMADESVSPPHVYVYAIDGTGARRREYDDATSGNIRDIFLSDVDHMWVLRELPFANPGEVEVEVVDFVNGIGASGFSLSQQTGREAWVDP